MKEEELRGSGDPKHSHLQEDLHVEVEYIFRRIDMLRYSTYWGGSTCGGTVHIQEDLHVEVQYIYSGGSTCGGTVNIFRRIYMSRYNEVEDHTRNLRIFEFLKNYNSNAERLNILSLLPFVFFLTYQAFINREGIISRKILTEGLQI